MELQEYSWWGQDNSPPEHLKTKKQLSAINLSPKNPVGFIDTNKYRLFLYDINDEQSVKPKKRATAKQLKSLEKARFKKAFTSWLEDFCDNFYHTYFDSIQSIKALNKFLIVDFATTGLDYPEIIEIAIINQDRKILMNTLIKPSQSIEKDAIDYHSITDEMLKNAPILKEIYPQLINLISHQNIFTWSDFDLKAIKYTLRKYGLPQIQFSRYDLQWLYTIYKEDFWEDDIIEYPKLESSHRALDDCLKAYEKLKEILTNYPKDLFDFIPEKFKDLSKEDIVKAYEKLYPKRKLVIMPKPKDDDVALGNFHSQPQPREGDLCLSPRHHHHS